MNDERLNALFRSALANLPGYPEALDIARKNTKGNLWLIGGTVSRLLVRELYGIPLHEFDYDFMCDALAAPLVVPDGWTVSHEKFFGNPTFFKGTLEVDVWPLVTHRYIQNYHLEPTIENFLNGTPFTVQSLVFDVKKQRLVGDVGIKSVLDRTFGVNNLEEARFLAGRKSVSIDERMKQKAETMGMRVIPSGE